MGLIILLILIVTLIIFLKKQEREERNQKIEEDKQFKLSCVHHGNKSMIKKCGEENFIKFFGKEQYNDIIAGRDTKIAEMLKEYKNQI